MDRRPFPGLLDPILGIRLMNLVPDPAPLTLVPFEHINFGDPIFISIRADYPDFSDWQRKAMATSARRCAKIIDSPTGYAGVAVLKLSESGDLKISTFKVGPTGEGSGMQIAFWLLLSLMRWRLEPLRSTSRSSPIMRISRDTLNCELSDVGRVALIRENGSTA